MKPKRFLVRVFSDDPTGYSASDQLVVLMTKELIKTIRLHRAELLRLQKTLPSFHEIRSFSYAVDAVDSDETKDEDTPENQLGADLSGDYVEIDAETELKFKELNMDYCLMCVREDGVKWEFVPKHTSVTQSSATLPFDEILPKRKTKPKKKPRTLDDLLEAWNVHAPGMWENESGPKDWFAVSNDSGIVAYFGKESDALRFRLDEINRELNG